MPSRPLIRASRPRPKLFYCLFAACVGVCVVQCAVMASANERKLGIFGFGKKKGGPKPVTRPSEISVESEGGFGGGVSAGGITAGGITPGATGTAAMPASPKQYMEGVNKALMDPEITKKLGVPQHMVDRMQKVFQNQTMLSQIQQVQQKLMDPKLAKAINDMMTTDPSMRAMLQDAQQNGWGAAARHMATDPAIMQKFFKVMRENIDPGALDGLVSNIRGAFSDMKQPGTSNPAQDNLMSAVEKGDMAAVQTALESKPNLNGKDIQGRTALHIAVATGKVDIAELLLKAGADVTMAAMGGYTSLHIAASIGSEAMIAVLLKYGASKEVRTHEGLTAFDLLLKNPKHRPASSSSAARLLSGDTSTLPFAARFCDIEKVKELLKTEKINTKDPAGMTALHWAARQADLPIFNVLVEHHSFKGADLANAQDSFNNTALHYACGFGATEIALKLVEAGSNIDSRNRNGNRPFALGLRDPTKKVFVDKELGYDLACALLIPPMKSSEGAISNPLEAAMYNNTKEFQKFESSVLDKKDERGRTVAHWAAGRNNLEILKSAIEKLPSLVNTTDAEGNRPIHMAALYGSAELTKYLMDKGTQSFGANSVGAVPYDFAKLRKDETERNDVINALVSEPIKPPKYPPANM